MDVKTNNRKLILIMYCLISVISLVILSLNNESQNDFEQWIKMTGFLVVAHIIISLIVIIQFEFKLFSPACLFFLCLCLFNWGQVIIITFFPDYHFIISGGNMFSRYPEEYYERSCIYILIFLSCCVLGMMFGRQIYFLNNGNIGDYTKVDNLINRYALRKAAIIVLLITLPFNIYTTIKYIILSMSGGYIALFESGISDMVSTIGKISIVGFVLLMYAMPEKSRNILICSSVFYLISMFSGDRSTAIVAVLTLWCFYMHIGYGNRKVRLIYIVLLAIFAYFGMSALATLLQFRDYADEKSIKLFIDLYRNDLRNNAFLRSIEEFGATVADVSLVQMYLSDTGNYMLGWSIVSGLFSIFPNIGGYIGSITISGVFGRILQEQGIYGGYTTIGGSCIAESIINFGILFFIESFIIGIIFAFISCRLEKIRDVRIAYYIMPVYMSLFWVRGYFGEMVRGIVWSWLIIYFIKMLKGVNVIDNSLDDKNKV